MIRSPLLAALLLCGAPALAAPAWTFDAAGSELAVTTTFEKAPVPGRWRTFDVAVALDPERPADGRIRVTIDTASADFGNADMNKEVRGPDWFDTGRHPKAEFVAPEVRRTAAGRYEAVGTLTVKGIAKPLTVPFTWKPEGDGAVMSGEFSVARATYRIGLGEWETSTAIGADAKVRFTVRLRKGG